MGQVARPFLKGFLLIFIPFGLGHFISYLFRTINAVIYSELATDLSLPAGSLGLLTGIYFLTFALAQIPLGVLLDRYGPRIVQSVMLLIAAAGSLIFAFSYSKFGLLTGRGLIGLGVAGSLMSAIKAFSIWLPPERIPLSTACLLSVGGLGVIISTTPLHWLLTWISWRQAFILIAIFTVIVSAIIFFSVRREYSTKTIHFAKMFGEVRTLYCTWSFWRLALYSLLPQAIYMSVLALWMAPWLRDVAGLNSSQMANALMTGALGMMIGSLMFGSLIDYLQRLGVQPLMVCGGGIVLFIMLQILMVSGLSISPWLITFGFGLFGSSVGMNYAIVAQSVPNDLAGRVTTSFNLLIFLLTFGVQWFVGAVIGLWDDTTGHYPFVAYRWALGLLIAGQIPGVLLWLSFKPWERIR